MHPGFIGWWRHRGGEGSYEGEAREGCGPGGGWERASWHRGGGWGGEQRFGRFGHGEGEGFGVRRPLRFLAYRLELDEKQVAELAKILDELKTERAQAAVDDRRALASFADAVGGETFDAAKAGEAGELRVKTAERLRTAVVNALGKIHALLDSDQRERLAYLIRTGVLIV